MILLQIPIIARLAGLARSQVEPACMTSEAVCMRHSIFFHMKHTDTTTHLVQSTTLLTDLANSTLAPLSLLLYSPTPRKLNDHPVSTLF